MSWAVGFDEHWKRDIGYGVPAYCDHPGCMAEIDRGLANVCCGEQLYGGDDGCGLYFCAKHHSKYRNSRCFGACSRCANYKEPFKPTPDHPDWIKHKATDPSWAQWREENGIPVAQPGADRMGSG